MAANCEKCGRKLKDKSYRFCPTHQYSTLRQARRSGKLQPLSFRTQDGVVRLGQGFLTLTDPLERETTSPQS